MKNNDILKSKVIISLVSLFGCILVGVNCFFKSPLSIVYQKSTFLDFYVVENKVNINCYVTIRNNSNKGAFVRLKALMPDEVKIGLLKEPVLYTENGVKNNEKLFVPNNTQKSFYVCFQGEFAGIEMKNDRLLPQIEIELIDD